MAHSDLIDSLINTYRNLNLMLRPIPNERAAVVGAGGKSLLDVLTEMRAREMVTSQHLKNLTISDARASAGLGELAIPQPFNDQDVRVLLSEFGTAREAILALVRNMSDELFDRERTGAGGATSIRAVIEDLVAQDKTVLAQINSLVPAAVA